MSEISNFLPAGTLLHGGQYRIERHLTSGGFGNTYLATDVNLKAKVAIKEFYIKMINYREGDSRTVGVSNADNLEMFHSLREKFKKEAQRIFKIQHNNVVRVYSLFEEYSTVYYAMEFIEGESLNSLLKREGALPESLVRSVFTQMLDALDVVHQAGLLHLDIKPHNIMMTANGVAKLIDFGASKHANKAEATTLTGFAFTPEYAAPELTNQEYDEIGAWTDIYSLGITLYRLLSNAPVPSKKDIRVNGAEAFHYSQPVSSSMQRLIVSMTQAASERRPQSVEQLKTLAMQLDDSQAVPLPQPLPQSQPENEATVVIEEPKPIQSEHTSSHQTTDEPRWLLVRDSYELLTVIITLGIVVAVVVGWMSINLLSSSDEKSQDEPAESIAAQKHSVKNMNITTSLNKALGSCIYTGEVDDNNLPNGKGKARFADGSIYNGEFVHGKLEGKAKFTNGDGSNVFEGTFKNDAYHNGKLTDTSTGSYFIGDFKDGEPVKSSGKVYDRQGNEIN